MQRGSFDIPDCDIYCKPVDLAVLEKAIRKKLEDS